MCLRIFSTIFFASSQRGARTGNLREHGAGVEQQHNNISRTSWGRKLLAPTWVQSPGARSIAKRRENTRRGRFGLSSVVARVGFRVNMVRYRVRIGVELGLYARLETELLGPCILWVYPRGGTIRGRRIQFLMYFANSGWLGIAPSTWVLNKFAEKKKKSVHPYGVQKFIYS